MAIKRLQSCNITTKPLVTPCKSLLIPCLAGSWIALSAYAMTIEEAGRNSPLVMHVFLFCHSCFRSGIHNYPLFPTSMTNGCLIKSGMTVFYTGYFTPLSCLNFPPLSCRNFAGKISGINNYPNSPPQ